DLRPLVDGLGEQGLVLIVHRLLDLRDRARGRFAKRRLDESAAYDARHGRGSVDDFSGESAYDGPMIFAAPAVIITATFRAKRPALRERSPSCPSAPPLPLSHPCSMSRCSSPANSRSRPATAAAKFTTRRPARCKLSSPSAPPPR